MTDAKDVRDWMFRSLLFEADAESFQRAGIRVGADQSDFERKLFEEALAPFPIAQRNEALRMARAYAIIHCFENSVRSLVKERLQQALNEKWWAEGIPPSIQKQSESRKADATKNSWLQGEKSELITFADFGNLAQIILHNWDKFSDLIPNQHWIKQKFDELEKARNFIAHNRSLSQSEFARIEMYINDWNAQVGI